MDWTDLSEPSRRAHSNIRAAFTALLDAALDQITGTEGLRELRPRTLQDGECLASGEVRLEGGHITAIGEGVASAPSETPEFDRSSRRHKAACAEYAKAFGCGTAQSKPPGTIWVSSSPVERGTIWDISSNPSEKVVPEIKSSKKPKRRKGKAK